MRVIKPFYSQNKQYKAGDDISSVPAIQIEVLKARGFVADDATEAEDAAEATEPTGVADVAEANEPTQAKRGRKPKEA